MNDSAGWSSLLAESDRRYKGVLGVARRLAAKPPPSNAHIALAAVDDAVAALVALRGPAESRKFFADLQPLMTQIGRKLSMFPDSIDPRSMMTLLCVSAFSAAVATPLELPEFSVNDRLDDILADRESSPQDKVTAALLCLDFGRVYDVDLLPAKVDTAASSLIAALDAAIESRSDSKEVQAAWDIYLRGFPRALEAKAAQWRHLLLAARLVLGKLGGIPAGEVAESLHRRIKTIASGESS